MMRNDRLTSRELAEIEAEREAVEQQMADEEAMEMELAMEYGWDMEPEDWNRLDDLYPR
jgi:hypothetical protein